MVRLAIMRDPDFNSLDFDLQEILRRYVAIGRRDAIGPAFEALLGIVDDVLPIELDDVQAARHRLDVQEGISARDALHLATMARNGVVRIMSFDSGFDAAEGVERIHR